MQDFFIAFPKFVKVLKMIPNQNNLNHQDIGVKKAAIMTLGFICE
jgi:hypothetical protein